MSIFDRELTPLDGTPLDGEALGRQAGDVAFNFQKFLVSPAGDVVARFRPQVDPEAAEVVGAIEQALR